MKNHQNNNIYEQNNIDVFSSLQITITTEYREKGEVEGIKVRTKIHSFTADENYIYIATKTNIYYFDNNKENQQELKKKFNSRLPNYIVNTKQTQEFIKNNNIQNIQDEICFEQTDFDEDQVDIEFTDDKIDQKLVKFAYYILSNKVENKKQSKQKQEISIEIEEEKEQFPDDFQEKCLQQIKQDGINKGIFILNVDENKKISQDNEMLESDDNQYYYCEYSEEIENNLKGKCQYKIVEQQNIITKFRQILKNNNIKCGLFIYSQKNEQKKIYDMISQKQKVKFITKKQIDEKQYYIVVFDKIDEKQLKQLKQIVQDQKYQVYYIIN